jgi:hypothetical protein
MTATEKKKVKTLQKELVDLLLKKANVSKQKLYDSAVRIFVNDNLDLLTPIEIKRYKGIVL